MFKAPSTVAAICFIAIPGSLPRENIPVRVVIDTRGVARDIFPPGEYRVAWLPDTNYQAAASRV